MNFFGSAARAWDRIQGAKEATAGDPVPERFKVLKADLVNGFTIATVEYPDCLPASRLKILVFKHDVRGILQLVKRLDPHFTDDHPKVIARFRCDPEGAGYALSFAYHYR